MKTRNIKFFFNAIYYGFWLIQNRSYEITSRFSFPFADLIAKYLFPTKLRKMYLNNRNQNISQFMKQVYDKESGWAIFLAKMFFDYTTYAYGLLISFPFAALCVVFKWRNPIVYLLILVLPLLIIAVPVYRATHYKNRYLHYFNQFERKGSQWAKKCKLYAWIYILLAIILIITGFIIGLILIDLFRTSPLPA